MRYLRAITCVVFCLSLPCLAQKVTVDYDKNTDFGKFETYAWKQGHPTANPLMNQRIVAAIDYHLSMKGYQKVEENADMMVAYYASADEKVQITEYDYRPRWKWDNEFDIRSILVGTVIVDLIDTSDGQLFWRAVGSDTIAGKPQRNEKKINKAAKKMFKQFPPE